MPDKSPGQPSGESPEQPPGQDRQPAIRTVAMPADANPNGDIFGGWVLSQMDIAGGLAAVHRAGGRITTVAVEGMSFHLPVYVGDEVSCYAEVVRVGRSSLSVAVETWARRRDTGKTVQVTAGIFIYVALDKNGRPRPVADRGGDG